MKFIIIDGYDKKSRDDLAAAGMKLAGVLYQEMLAMQLPEAEGKIVYPSDPDYQEPTVDELKKLAGVLWTGCNATIYDEDPRVLRQIALAKLAYEAGTPQFGSCWGLQMAAVAAGGECNANPKGREMGIARRIKLTGEGKNHPMMEGRSEVFEAFISHVDEVTRLPEEATVLAGNDFTSIQALVVKHDNGEFWAVQYHPEYDLNEMACLIVAREAKLIELGFYRGHDDLMAHVEAMKTLSADPARSDLRWRLVIDDDVLEAEVRTLEFANWVKHQVVPRMSGAK